MEPTQDESEAWRAFDRASFNVVYPSLLRHCERNDWPRLERLAHVVYAYLNGVYASKLHPSLPDRPGMASANAVGTILSGALQLSQFDQLDMPDGADPTSAGAKWLDRLRREIRSRSPSSNENDEADFIDMLLALLPHERGRPRGPKKFRRTLAQD